MLTRISLAFVGLSALLGAAAPAHAQGAPAAPTETREQEARTACAAGRVDEGIKILAELFAQTEDMTYVFNQGRCFQQNGRTEEALTRFREFLRRAGAGDVEARKEAEGFVAELETDIAARDQKAADATARAGNGRTLRLTGAALVASGAVAVLVGVGLSLKVRAQQEDTEAYANGNNLDFAVLDRKIADGNRYEAWQWPAYLLGAAAIVGGGTCYWIGRGRSAEERVALRGLVTGSGAHGSLEVRF